MNESRLTKLFLGIVLSLVGFILILIGVNYKIAIAVVIMEIIVAFFS